MPNACGVVIREWLAVADTMEMDKKATSRIGGKSGQVVPARDSKVTM